MKCAFFILFFGVYTFGTEIKTYRLSNDAIPSHYSIKIRPDIGNDIFDGEVSIYVRTKTILDKITLHASRLNISEAYVNNVRSKIQDEDNEKISLQYDNDCIQPGEHILRIKYIGILENNGTGFIKAPFKFHNEEGFILVTDFEPTRARKAFPCFDEPSFKAKYSIRLIAPDNTYKAISNMPAIHNFTTPEGIVYDFATSLPMSTYLVSFAITKYGYYEDIYEDGDRKIPIRIYTYNASKENNDFAVNCTKTALKFYSEYTNISYPLSKLDMIEYTRTASAATENWGLITFRQGLLTLNLGIYEYTQIQLVMYHELSHFWFGNLVTNDWWNDIWLQEGLATYMSYKLYSRDWNEQKEKLSTFFNGFFEAESAEPTRPIVNYLKTQDDVLERFDIAVYDKGAAIFLMVESIIGEEAFQKTMQTYLKKYAYKTVTTNDFISTLEEVVPNINLRAFIESYLYQNRFPLISVHIDNGSFVLKQQVCQTTAKFSESGQKWTVPITYVTDVNRTPTFVWFDKDMDSLTIEVPEAKWILLNTQGTGLYKAFFSENSWATLINHFKELSMEESAALVEEAMYSYTVRLINCDILINLMKQVELEKQWNFFLDFHLRMEERLRCNNYPEELSSYTNFLQKRLNETKFPSTLMLNLVACLKEEGLMTKEQQEHLRVCAKWIRENLTVSINDVPNKP